MIVAQTRRAFLTKAAAVVGTVPLALPALSAGKERLSQEAILALFKSLPGDVAIKIQAPAIDGKPEFLVESNAAKQMFVGSAIKIRSLQALRQADSPNVVQTITARLLALDASVWSVDSATFNPPNLIGKVAQRTALEAMILHSDNTATVMCLNRLAQIKCVSSSRSAGLKSTMIPESTRTFFWLSPRSTDYKTFTWEETGAAANLPIVNSPLNRVESLASSADDFRVLLFTCSAGRIFSEQSNLERVSPHSGDGRRHLAAANAARG